MVSVTAGVSDQNGKQGESGKLIVLGSVNADHVLRVNAFPRPGETVMGHGYTVIPGGKGANQAVAAARLGANTGFIACVGDDDFGRTMITRLQHDGIDTAGVTIVPDMPTGIALIQIAADGENAISISPEANGCLTEDMLETHLDFLRKADALLLQLETPLEAVHKAVAQAAASGVHVVLNPAPARALPDSLLSQVSMITPNETEAEVLTGVRILDKADAQRAADILHDKGVKTVLITLGEKGAFLSTPENRSQGGRIVSGYAVEAVDTTAAGDTFNGALVAAMQRGESLEAAIGFAHAAAAISVTRLGAQTSIPTRDEVEAFRKKHGESR